MVQRHQPEKSDGSVAPLSRLTEKGRENLAKGRINTREGRIEVETNDGRKLITPMHVARRQAMSWSPSERDRVIVKSSGVKGTIIKVREKICGLKTCLIELEDGDKIWLSELCIQKDGDSP